MTRGPVHHQQSGQRHSKSAYTYDAEGNILQVDKGQTATYVYYALNRRVRAQTAAATYESLPSNSWTWNYTYDYLNRLWTAIANPATIPEGCQETYDPWGNRTAQTAISGYPCTPASFTVNTNNQLAMPYYDAAGNMTTDVAGSTYTYDAEDRVTSVTGGGSTTNYTYGADGQRVSKQTGADTYYYSYDDDGSVLTRYLSISGGAPTVVNQEVWFAGKHLGTITGVSNQFARDTQDQIGSERLSLDPSGNPYAQMNSLPFGDGLNINGNPLTPLHFTGKERDPESGDGIATNGNDYLGARYYSSNMGRFLSPDPSGLAYAHLFNPQSFNLYGYVQNNPLTNTDPTGLDCVHINNDTGAYEGFESGDCDNSTDALANSGHYVDGTINQISFNGQNQVIGYSGSTGDGQFDSFGGSLNAGGTAFSLNPYSLTGTAPRQSVSVTANPSGGPDTSTASIFSLIASGKIQPSSGTAEMRAVPKLTTGQIYSLCAMAVSLGAGGTVPGGSPRGTASLSPSEDTPPINMPFPGKNGLQVTAMNEGAAKVEGPVAGLALVGSLGECVNAVSKAN